MKVRAPGKLMLTGSYVVLEGAPAIVCAVDRYAVADGARIDPAPSAEIAAAMTRAPTVDTSALHDPNGKLGLGSSAAALVAALGWEAAEAGADLGDSGVRAGIFERARAAHAKVQGGGSGVDIAASVWGGTLAYRLAGGVASHRTKVVPEALVIEAYFAGRSARTSTMRAKVDALRERAPAEHRAIFAALERAAEDAERALDAGDAKAFVVAGRAAREGLGALATAADAPIIPEDAAALDALAQSSGSVFLPSGAGGGDVFVHLGLGPSSRPFTAEIERFGWKKLPLRIETLGVSRQ